MERMTASHDPNFRKSRKVLHLINNFQAIPHKAFMNSEKLCIRQVKRA